MITFEKRDFGQFNPWTLEYPSWLAGAELDPAQSLYPCRVKYYNPIQYPKHNRKSVRPAIGKSRIETLCPQPTKIVATLATNLAFDIAWLTQ